MSPESAADTNSQILETSKSFESLEASISEEGKDNPGHYESSPPLGPGTHSEIHGHGKVYNSILSQRIYTHTFLQPIAKTK